MFMKKIFTLVILCSFAFNLKAQTTFTDDFESYVVGSYLGSQSTVWTTWAGASGEGTTTDVKIANTKAHSGNNSIYFSSTSASGGPTDVVLPFGGALNIGHFTFKAWFFIPKNKTAYFNFQGNVTVATDWALQCYLNEDGSMIFDNGSITMLASNFPNDAWFELKVDINLNTSQWDIYIDNNLKGSFANPKFQIASLDLYPANTLASYWVDDVSYEYTPYTIPSINGAVIGINIDNGMVGLQRTPSIMIRNLGNTIINNFDLVFTQNGASAVTKNITGISISKLKTYTVNLTSPFTLLSGPNTFVAIISNVNGNLTDGDVSDDVKTLVLNPIQPAIGKVVVAEEATGTWCGWCPRGQVMMKNMTETYGNYFAGIAVHNNDPMTHTAYDAWVGTKISGYPSALVNRGNVIDPLGIEPDFLQEIQIAPQALMINGGDYNSTTRELKVTVALTFQQAVTGTYNLAVVLTEDGIKGSSSGYNQTNYYAGGSRGVMGGFETLSDPVPANQMVYDHVARDISNVNGESVFPSSINVRDTFKHEFTFTLNSAWNSDNIHIIGMLFNPSGKIENASSTTIAEAVANGNPPIAPQVTGIAKIATPKEFAATLYPNPANQEAFVRLNIQGNENVILSIYQINGALVAQRDYSKLSGDIILPMELKNFVPGLYCVKANIGENVTVLKLMVE